MSASYFDNATERHLLGDLLDDEGFCSWKEDYSKPSINYDESSKLILGDLRNRNDAFYLPSTTSKHGFLPRSIFEVNVPSTYSSSVQKRSPTRNTATCIKFNVNAPEFYPSSKLSSPTSSLKSVSSQTSNKSSENDQRFTPVKQKKKKTQRNNTDSTYNNAPSTNVIGLNPVKTSSRKDVIARSSDYAKDVSHKNEPAKQIKSTSDWFINVKRTSNKPRSSPTTRSSSKDNMIVSTIFKFESKFQALNQLNKEEASASENFGQNEKDEEESSVVSESKKPKNRSTKIRRGSTDKKTDSVMTCLMVIGVALLLWIAACGISRIVT